MGRADRGEIVGLDHVLVAAPPGCEAQARRFYGELLGLPEIPKPASVLELGGVWFRCGAQQLHVGVSEHFRPERKGHPAFSVADEAGLAQLAERLEAAAAPVRWDERLAGVRRFYTDDPWGNRIELLALAAAAPGEHAERAER